MDSTFLHNNDELLNVLVGFSYLCLLGHTTETKIVQFVCGIRMYTLYAMHCMYSLYVVAFILCFSPIFSIVNVTTFVLGN